MALQVGQKPSSNYVEALKECVKTAYMSLYNRSHGQLRKLHRVGIASETHKVIHRKMQRGDTFWKKAGQPDDTTVYRRLNEMANEADFLVFVEPKGSGWYKLADGVVKP